MDTKALERGQKTGFKAFLRNSLNNLETDGTIRRHFAPDASVPVFISSGLYLMPN
jgi:hypothetical protein